MDVLIKSVKIIDSKSAFNGEKKDILIADGVIQKIENTIDDKNATLFEAENLHVSPGWFDMRANYRDPGFEHKETIKTGANAAIAGGFTGTAIMPSTLPVADSKSIIEYINSKSKNLPVDIYIYGSLSKEGKGIDIAELYDMNLSGAIGFTDDKNSIYDGGLLSRGLHYVKSFDGLILSFPYNKNISYGGEVNEGVVSTSLGLKGIPSVAENAGIERDISILEYTGGKLHIGPISTEKAPELILAGKKNKLLLSSDIAAHQIYFDDTCLNTFDSNYKLMPPLRTHKEIEALINGLINGSIDAISSDHCPEDEENKNVEFDYAAYGIIAQETAFAAANTILNSHLSIEKIIEKFCHNPRKILNVSLPQIKIGEKANLTFFNPTLNWVFEKHHIKSKSKNTPFIGKKFIGKVLGIYNKGVFIKND
jgi:dihydroorotase